MSKDVILPDGKVRLEDGMSFEWVIQGVRFKSTIYQFEPFRRLYWRSSNPLISTCHIWALEERNGSMMVITDETQRGLLPTLLGFLVRPKLKNGQEVWLDSLAARIFESSVLPEPLGSFRMEAIGSGKILVYQAAMRSFASGFSRPSNTAARTTATR
jgi:hypothetical protein